MDYKALNGICEEYARKAVEWRRDLHRYPEPAWTEFRTTAFLAKTLEEAGVPVLMGKQVVCPEYAMGYPEERVIKAAMERAVEQGADPSYVQRTEGYTGLCAVIDTGREGPVVAIRMDIDSNDVEENRTDAHRPQKEGFASCNAGAMHACGHDGHAVIGLITALSLYRIRQQLQGKVKVIFQPAEEGVRGALSVCKSGILDDVDFVLGGHIAETSDGSLQVCTNTGGYLATDKFDVTFKGEASHAGGSPEKGRNALLAAALATLGMQTQVQDGRGMGRCNVGLLTAGTGRNVIPAQATLKAETRGSTSEIAQDIYRHAMDSIEGAARMYGCTYEVTKMGGAASAQSDESLRQVVEQVVRDSLGMEPDTLRQDLGGSEDFTYMMRTVQEHGGKAMHMFLGTRRWGSAHNEWFDFGEDVLVFSAKIFASCALRLAGRTE